MLLGRSFYGKMHIGILCVHSAVTLLCFSLESIHFVLSIPFLVQYARPQDDTVYTTETSGQAAASLRLNGFNVVIKLDSKSGNLTHCI